MYFYNFILGYLKYLDFQAINWNKIMDMLRKGISKSHLHIIPIFCWSKYKGVIVSIIVSPVINVDILNNRFIFVKSRSKC